MSSPSRSSGLVVNRASAPIGTARFLAASRTSTVVMAISRPVRETMISRFSCRIFASPEPTVPKPASPRRSVFIEPSYLPKNFLMLRVA